MPQRLLDIVYCPFFFFFFFFNKANVGNDNITSSLVLTCDQAGGAGGQKGKKDRLIADYFVPGLSKGDQEI